MQPKHQKYAIVFLKLLQYSVNDEKVNQNVQLQGYFTELKKYLQQIL